MVNKEISEKDILNLLSAAVLNSNFKGSDVLVVHAALKYLGDKQKELYDNQETEEVTKGEGT